MSSFDSQARLFWGYKDNVADVTRALARSMAQYMAETKPSSVVNSSQLLRLSAEAALRTREELRSEGLETVTMPDGLEVSRWTTFFNRPVRRWISSLPWAEPCGDEVNKAMNIMANTKFTLDRTTMAMFLKLRDNGWTDPTLEQYIKHVPQILREGQVFHGYMVPDQRGRLYHDARGVSWQGAKVFRAAIRFAQPYGVKRSDLLNSFEDLSTEKGVLEALKGTFESPLAVGEAVAYAQAESGSTNYISQIDMSASGAWYVAAMTGDTRMWNDLLSGDFYSQVGQWLHPEAKRSMSKTLYRLMCKRLIMLTLYNITGGGLFLSLMLNEPEVFKVFCDIIHADPQTADGQKKIISEFSTMIGKLQTRYPGLGQFREWSLRCAKDKKTITWLTPQGFIARHMTWKWDDELPADEIARRGLPSGQSHKATTEIEVTDPITGNPRKLKLFGWDFGYGKSDRGFGPNLVHQHDAAVITRSICNMGDEGIPAAPIHDSLGCPVGLENRVNEIYIHSFESIIREGRNFLNKIGCPFTGTEVDFNGMKKIQILR